MVDSFELKSLERKARIVELEHRRSVQESHRLRHLVHGKRAVLSSLQREIQKHEHRPVVSAVSHKQSRDFIARLEEMKEGVGVEEKALTQSLNSSVQHMLLKAGRCDDVRLQLHRYAHKIDAWNEQEAFDEIVSRVTNLEDDETSMLSRVVAQVPSTVVQDTSAFQPTLNASSPIPGASQWSSLACTPGAQERSVETTPSGARSTFEPSTTTVAPQAVEVTIGDGTMSVSIDESSDRIHHGATVAITASSASLIAALNKQRGVIGEELAGLGIDDVQVQQEVREDA